MTLNADQRVFLDTGSTIDVKGLWVDETIDSALIKVQLNSVELTNDYGQKNGWLKGQYITVCSLWGTPLANVSGYLVSQPMTAGELSTKGGSVTLNAPSGDIIVKSGATIDFSGGGYRFAGGNMDTTKLYAEIQSGT